MSTETEQEATQDVPDAPKLGGRPKGSKNKKTVEAEARKSAMKEKLSAKDESSSSVVVDKLSDPHDKKIEYFSSDKPWEYNLDKTSYDWGNESPLNVPKEIKDKYPGMDFRWRAKDDKAGTLKKGNAYHGWQKFSDPSLGYTEGLSAGGDTLLCAMPKERAEAYRQHVRRQSTELVRDSQKGQTEDMEKAITDNPVLRDAVGEYGNMISQTTIGASKSVNRKTGEVREQYRGEHPEETIERMRKMIEDRNKNRVYSR